MISILYHILIRTTLALKLECGIAIIEHQKDMNLFSLPGIQKEQKEREVSVERLITNSTSISKKINDHNIRLQNICKRLEQNPGYDI